MGIYTNSGFRMHANFFHMRATDLYRQSPPPYSPLQPELAVHVAAKQLLPVHESIIIGSPGLWGLASPAACALRAHFYLRASSHRTFFLRLSLVVQRSLQDHSSSVKGSTCAAGHCGVGSHF